MGNDSPAGSPNICMNDSVGWMPEEYGLTLIRDLHHGAYEQAFAKLDEVSEASNIRVASAQRGILVRRQQKAVQPSQWHVDGFQTHCEMHLHSP